MTLCTTEILYNSISRSLVRYFYVREKKSSFPLPGANHNIFLISMRQNPYWIVQNVRAPNKNGLVLVTGVGV